jgi:hypothetical protein
MRDVTKELVCFICGCIESTHALITLENVGTTTIGNTEQSTKCLYVVKQAEPVSAYIQKQASLSNVILFHILKINHCMTDI